MAAPVLDPTTNPPLGPDELDQLKARIQSFIASRLVIVIGSGLSAAEGISGMGALATYLLAEVPPKLQPAELASWHPIADGLTLGKGLEEVLLAHPPSHAVETQIVRATADLIRRDEARVIGEVVAQSRTLRLTRLLRLFVNWTEAVDVVTPNYDRLIEFGAEDAGLGVDTMFVGSALGRYDRAGCAQAFTKLAPKLRGKGPRKVTLPHVRLNKPHGSLDWIIRHDKPVRIAPEFNPDPLIITPGSNKYLHGYRIPFDQHRERANGCIDRASRFLVIGYGFNDQHLETHLSPAIRDGRPTLILTHTLSVQARQLIGTCDSVIGLEYASGVGGAGSVIRMKSGDRFLKDSQLWDLGQLMAEVFGA
jgi:hypothetical protein